MRRGSFAKRRVASGFTYVWVMAMVAVVGVGLSAIGPMWADAMRRDRENELLRVGKLYAHAIASYHRSSPGSEKRYPPSLEALLLDTRFVGTYRHLRKLYADPLQPGRPWGVLRSGDGGIRGVYSQSTDQPLRREVLDLGVVMLPAARQYAQWHFIPRVEP